MKIDENFSNRTTEFLCALAFAGVSIGLTGCGTDSAQTVHTIEGQKVQPAAQTDSRDMIVQTVTSHGKPGAGVTVKYSVPAKVNHGDIVDVEFDFSAPPGAGELTVEVRSEGVEILTQQTHQTFSFANDSTHKMPLSIYCGEEGRFYLNLFIVRGAGEGALGRQQTHSVPIQVGDTTVAKISRDNVTIDEEGNPIRSLPAKETISEADEEYQ